MGVNYGPSIVTSGLKLCFDPGNQRSYPGSGTSVSDLSITRAAGTLTNSPSYSADGRGSFVFNNTSMFVTAGRTRSTLATTGQTWCAWFKLSATPDSNTDMVFGVMGFNSGLVVSTTPRLQMRQHYFTTDYNPNVTADSTTTLQLNTWYYGVGTFNSTGTIELYLNGSLETRNTFSTISTALWDGTVLMAGQGYDFYNGSIGAVQLYDRVLPAAEISQNFNALRGRYGI